MERRLAAILSADAVAYSRLMAEDEEQTARTLASCRQRMSDRVGQRGGRVVDAPGDNLLAEFPSVVDAVRCGVEIQDELAGLNAGLPEARRLRFRIGIHLGDVLVDGERIVGDGVNVAARLEGLAEPGCLCISGEAFDQVDGKLDLAFAPAGEQTLKNRPKPVRVYRVGTAALRRSERLAAVRKSWRAGTLVVALGLLGLWLLLARSGPPESGTAMAEASVAVLPFENTSRDPANEPFTLGIHEDLLAHVAKIGSIRSISRTSVLRYRDTQKTLPQIAAELGVATILEGGVQRAGDRVRVNVQLVDAATDEHLWTSTYDRQLSAANIFAIQSEIATAVAAALEVTLSQEERQRIASAPTQSLAAVERYFLGKELLERRTLEALSEAVAYFEQVIELDPEFALAYSGLADAYMILPEYSTAYDPKRAWERSEAAVKRALELDPELPEALASMGWNRLIHYYDWQGAETLLRRAISVEAYNTNALHWLSHVLSWQGRHEEALETARRAVAVDPFSRLMSMNLSYILMDAGHFDRSIEVARAGLARFRDNPEQLGNLWLTYQRAGRSEEAAEALQQWASVTGRDVEAAAEVGAAFVRHRRTGEMQRLSPELLARFDALPDDLGQVHAFVGDGESALAALERAYAERSGVRSLLSMKVNPGYDFLRGDARFLDLMQRLGLEP